MLKDFTGARNIYIACGYTDLRKGIDGLSYLVQGAFHMDPFTDSLFLFCGRRADRIKALYWEGDGFVLLYKRLESSGRFQWPRTPNEVKSITQQQYRWLMEGLCLEQRKAMKDASNLDVL
jgi:transposase